MIIIKTILIFFLMLLNLNAKELKKVKLQLSWFNQFQFAGYYMAKEKGFYKDLGLDVEIIPYNFNLDIPKIVNDLKVDFAIGRESLILDKSKGKDLKILYALFQASPLVLLTTKESNINNIEDFINRKIMSTRDDLNEISIGAMLKSKNIDENDLKFLKHSHDISDLINKKTDIVTAYVSKSPYTLKEKNIPYNVFAPKDYGFDLYSDFLFTNSSLALKNPKLVNDFKKASLKGWEYAYENIDESIDLTYEKYNKQNLTKEELRYEANELKKLSYYNTEKLGLITEDKLQRIYDLYNILGLTKNKVSYKDFVFSYNQLELTREEKEYLKNKEEINLCISPNALPYSAIKKGKATGLISDYINLLENKLNTKITLIETSTWAESLKFIKEKKCDILSPATKNKSRLKYLNFSKPYFEVTSVLVTRNNIPYVKDLSKLKNIKIGVIEKYPKLQILRKKYPHITFVEMKSLKHGLKEVANKNLFGHISVLKGVWYYLQKEYLSQLKISSIIDKSIEVKVAIRNDDKTLTNIIGKAVLSTLDTKELEEMKAKWLNVDVDKDFDYIFLYKILFFISIILLFLLYRQNILKKSNLRLNKKVKEKTEELENINHSLEERIKEAIKDNLEKDRLLTQQSKLVSMGQMIQNIAHQWRQPLSVISIGASSLKLKKELEELDDKSFDKTIQSILKSTTHLSNTIEDFMYFFKPNKEKREFNIKNTIEKSIELLSSKLDQANITTVSNLKDSYIYGYESEFIQVIMNIITNSCDVLEKRDILNKFIFINNCQENTKITLNIKDNAGGINEDIIDKIFDPYFTTKHKSQGTGIGLYMSNLIISKYLNGTIKVENKNFTYEDKKYSGAKFQIILEKENEK